MQRGGPQEFAKGLRLPGEGIRDVREVSHKHLNKVWKCLQTRYLDDLKSSESRLKTSAIVWKRLIQTFQIFGKILMRDAVGCVRDSHTDECEPPSLQVGKFLARPCYSLCGKC